jgi:hypothetical protein
VSQKIKGSCLCGAVTYSSEAEPVITAICHCTDCQKQTGTAYSVVVGVPGDALDVSGEALSSHTTTGEDHGQPVERKFCSACGSPIVSIVTTAPEVVYLKAGTLDDTSWLEPSVEVWGRSALSFVEPGGRPRLERGPDMDAA